MSNPSPFTLLVSAALPEAGAQALAGSPYGPFELQHCADTTAAVASAQRAGIDALLIAVDPDDALGDDIARVAHDLATLVVMPAADDEQTIAWWQRGAQDVLTPEALADPGLPGRVRAAIER